MPRSTKGISGILAALFIIAISVGAYNVIMLGINQYDLYNTALVEKTSAQLNKINEEFEITDARINGGKFNVTVINTGSEGVKLIRLWVTNQTDGWYNNYTLTDSLTPGQQIKNLGQGLPLVAKNSSSYLLKVVSERGNMDVFKLAAAGEQSLNMQLFPLPRDIPTGQTLSVLFGVTNNATDATVVQSLQPLLTVTTSGSSAVKATKLSGPTPTSFSNLRQGDTAFFEWSYKIEGNKDDKISFNATLSNAKKGNWVKQDTTVTVDTFAEQSTTSLSSLGLSVSAPDLTGSLHFHAETSPYNTAHLRLEPILADTTNSFNVFDTAGEQMIWVTANTTDIIQIDAGNWNVTMHSEDTSPTSASTVTVTIDKVDKLGTLLLEPICTLTFTIDGGAAQDRIQSCGNLTSKTLNAQERIKATVTFVLGKFKMYYDVTNKETILKTPKQTPAIPSYLVYAGGDVELFIRNSGNSTIWIDESSRVVFRKAITGELYAGIVKSWTNSTDGKSGTISSRADSPKMPPNSMLKFKFSEPITMPQDPPPGSKVSVIDNKGNYDVFVRMSGYDQVGGFLLRVVKVGIVVV